MSALPARLLVLPGVLALALGTPAVAFADPPQDPAGNNGTIKVQPYGGVPGHGNSPHPGCDFRLQLFGFDDDQTGTVTFVGQAPTKDAVTKQPLAGAQLLSDDAARGGQDADAHFDVRGADLGLTGTPARQGFHVKVLVDADDAPGGAKTKVFWLDCPAPAAAPAPAGTAGGTAGGTTTTAPATSGETTSRTTSTTVQGVSAGQTSGAAMADVTSAATTVQDTELLAATRGSALRSATLATAGEAAPGSAAVSARSSGRTGVPTALAFTGLPAAALAGLGLLVLALGGLAVVAGRRRTTPRTT